MDPDDDRRHSICSLSAEYHGQAVFNRPGGCSYNLTSEHIKKGSIKAQNSIVKVCLALGFRLQDLTSVS